MTRQQRRIIPISDTQQARHKGLTAVSSG